MASKPSQTNIAISQPCRSAEKTTLDIEWSEEPMRLLQLKITSLRKVKQEHLKKANLILTIHLSVISALQSDYCNQGHLEIVDQSDYSKITTHSEKVIRQSYQETK